MMNRTLLLLGILVVLAGGIWFASQQNQQQKLEALGYDRSFAVENIAVVSRIFLADRQGNQTILTKKGSQWQYRDQFVVNESAITNLLHAIENVTVKQKPANAAVPNMIEDLATNGIKVEIYDQQSRLLKAYYVGGSTIDERGTYMIMDGADQPYVCYLPDREGNLRFRYNLKGTDWRDKTLFSAALEDIQSVAVEYPKQKNKSFKVEFRNNQHHVLPLYHWMTIADAPVNQAAIERFLIGFNRLAAEAFENKNPRRDSVEQLIPFCRIQLVLKDSTIQEASLYPIPQKYGRPGTKQVIERYFASSISGDFYLVQHRVFKEILWAYDYFFDSPRPTDQGAS